MLEARAVFFCSSKREIVRGDGITGVGGLVADDMDDLRDVGRGGRDGFLALVVASLTTTGWVSGDSGIVMVGRLTGGGGFGTSSTLTAGLTSG